MSSPATPKGIKTRERLIEASGAVFARKGCAASGVADICAAAGLAVGGFYRYFASKEEIIQALTRELRDDLIRDISELPQKARAEEEAQAIAQAFFSTAGRQLDAFKAMREAEAGDEALARDFYGPLAEVIAGRLGRFAPRSQGGRPCVGAAGDAVFLRRQIHGLGEGRRSGARFRGRRAALRQRA